jgi:hypothetical protein
LVFRVREAVGGFQHLGLKWTRKALNLKGDRYLCRYENLSELSAGAFNDEDGHRVACPICGYDLVRLSVRDGWLIEMCSAFPVVKRLDGPEFKAWLDSLPQAKLPTSIV